MTGPDVERWHLLSVWLPPSPPLYELPHFPQPLDRRYQGLGLCGHRLAPSGFLRAYVRHGPATVSAADLLALRLWPHGGAGVSGVGRLSGRCQPGARGRSALWQPSTQNRPAFCAPGGALCRGTAGGGAGRSAGAALAGAPQRARRTPFVAAVGQRAVAARRGGRRSAIGGRVVRGH